MLLLETICLHKRHANGLQKVVLPFIEEAVVSAFFVWQCQSRKTKVPAIHIIHNGEDDQSSQGSQYIANLPCILRWSSFYRADTSDRGKIKHTKEKRYLYKKSNVTKESRSWTVSST